MGVRRAVCPASFSLAEVEVMMASRLWRTVEFVACRLAGHLTAILGRDAGAAELTVNIRFGLM